MDEGQAVQRAQLSVVQLRLIGLLLNMLIDRGLLSRSEAAGLVQSATGSCCDDDPTVCAYRKLADELRQ